MKLLILTFFLFGCVSPDKNGDVCKTVKYECEYIDCYNDIEDGEME